VSHEKSHRSHLGRRGHGISPAAFAQDSSSSIQGEFATPAADWLPVQSSTSLTSDGKTITLTGVSPQTLIFADRPDRMAGTVPTKSIVDDWAKGKDSLPAVYSSVRVRRETGRE
jgi:hypothetical protein